MKKPIRNRKLKLNKLTVRRLDARELARVVGGNSGICLDPTRPAICCTLPPPPPPPIE